MAGKLELDYLYGPFQPKSSYGTCQECPGDGEHGFGVFWMAHARSQELWKSATLLSILCFSYLLTVISPDCLSFHFCRALCTLSCVKLKVTPQPKKRVESINECNTQPLHILIICKTISLWPFSLGIYLMYSCKEMFCTEGGKNVHLFKKLPPGCRYKQRFFHHRIIFLNTL